jgi:tripartite-type tricarboxylate transporter receptor subunit TctC
VKCLLIAAVGSICGCLMATASDTWTPNRPVRVIVPFQAGGPVDGVARIIGQQLGDKWGQSFVVENRTGAGGNIGASVVAQSPPDGYTLGMSSVGTHAANVTLFGAKMPYDPIKDFEPVSLLVQTKSALVVHPSLNIRNLKDLIAYAKSNPGKLSFGSSSIGSSQHLAGEMLKAATKIDIEHVSYRGQSQAIPDLLSGRISMMFISAGEALQHTRTGALVAVGLGSPGRDRALPDVIPLSEQGLPNFDALTWFGLVAPAGTPAPIINAYFSEISKSFAQPEVRARVERWGLEIVMMPPAEYKKYIASEIAKWGAIIKAAGVRIE